EREREREREKQNSSTRRDLRALCASLLSTRALSNVQIVLVLVLSSNPERLNYITCNLHYTCTEVMLYILLLIKVRTTSGDWT
ncbi:hypothetical protein B0T13DRAFT_477242, partial [Neurospora crassa]